MPPSWSTRLLSSNSSSSTPTRKSSRDHAAPGARPPPPVQTSSTQTGVYDPPPTLYNVRPNGSTPSPQQLLGTSRPRTSAGPQGKSTHGRSVSHPLPRIFGRKKSTQDINGQGGGCNDTDVPLDSGGLVPVLSDVAATPTRVISGKKGGPRDGGKADDEGKAQRRCMCCDVKVSVPRELDKFRCLGCLTVNDLRPIEEQASRRDEAMGRQGAAQGVRIPVPLSVERTKAVIEECLLSYLEARCRRYEEQLRDSNTATATTTHSTGTAQSFKTAVSGSSQVRESPTRLTNASAVSSPPHTPSTAASETPPLIHSATIRNLTDIDLSTFMQDDTPPPLQPPRSAHGPGPPTDSSNAPRVAPPMPARPSRRPPPPPLAIANRTPSQRLHPNGVLNGPRSPHMQQGQGQISPRPTPAELESRARHDRARTIFRPLEDYLAATYGDFTALNTAFSTVTPRVAPPGRTMSESSITVDRKLSTMAPIVSNAIDEDGWQNPGAFDGGMEGLDAKTLLLGELGENSSWWTGKLDRLRSDKGGIRRKQDGSASRRAVGSKSPNVNWEEVKRWYELVHRAGDSWEAVANRMASREGKALDWSAVQLSNADTQREIEEDLAEARDHVNRTLLKITENLLKRPGRPLKEAGDLRWLLILLANPSLFPCGNSGLASKPPAFRAASQPIRSTSGKQPACFSHDQSLLIRAHSTRDSLQHTGIIKRVFGLLAHTQESNHRYLINWLARFDEQHFVPLVDLTSGFVTHRITRSDRPSAHCTQRSRGTAVNDGGLIPDLSGSAANTSAQLHSALGLSGSIGGGGGNQKVAESSVGTGETEWVGDWQVKAAARWMSLLFAANNMWQGRRKDEAIAAAGQQARVDSGVNLEHSAPPHIATTRPRLPTQLLPTSTFYNISLDYHDLIADFKAWEARRDAKDTAKFSFCQYPLFLSMGAKIKILEYDARRQMEIKAREAYFDSVIRQRALDSYFHLRVRRECMVDDSLRQISEAVGAGQEALKKGLRVHFAGEEGIDAGGPRKEWFLMLVREIFDPEHGMFVYDEESRLCYFNPHSFETSDQFHLVGALLGLAIYNSTILDVALPGFAFRKLMAAAPAAAAVAVGGAGSVTVAKAQINYTLADLAEFRPRLAAGLQQLLDFEGDVETTYCWSFVAPVERFGVVTEVPLISNGEGTLVTNTNRQQFVDAYVRYLLDTSVARQFEPFKRGFFTVCAGNALSLFRADEIELLVRGSDEELDVDSLRAVAVYENWRIKGENAAHPLMPDPADKVDVVRWFWELFAAAPVARQRKLLTFITGSDRIPAVGATSLVLRIVAGGDGWGGVKEDRGRFPVARTCFNMLVLWRYQSKAHLEDKLWRALEESEGFGLK